MTRTRDGDELRPGLQDVQALPCLLDVEMPQEFVDPNGHVNVRHYMALHDQAGWEFFARVGADEEYLRTQRAGFFDAEHHLRYHAEVLGGDRIAIHGRAVGRSSKAFHGLWLMLDVANGRLANTFEFVTVHVDLERRRPAPIPAEVAERIDAWVDEHAGLGWPAPLSGSMAVRAGGGA